MEYKPGLAQGTVVRINYSNAYRLWASLHRENPRRLFIATVEQPRVGDTVPIELGLPGKADTFQFTSTVLERRGPGGRFAPGIFVDLTDEQYAGCREYLGIGPPASRRAPRVAGTGQGGSSLRVVVGDDDADILGFLERALSRFDVEIHAVFDGESALKAVCDLRPQLVLLDVVMPGMDGTEVCRRMRADEALANIPVILISALDRDELDAQADRAGANDSLAKPVDLGQLLNVVGEYLRP